MAQNHCSYYHYPTLLRDINSHTTRAQTQDKHRQRALPKGTILIRKKGRKERAAADPDHGLSRTRYLQLEAIGKVSAYY